ncbi:MAG: serine/threonine protein kinase, partial [Deltaproteobacteria bacterium]|nr:serine/threonine protein kinase [Deltaproteobacteria bacterium]
MAGSEFPPRYQALEQLGKGGGGEVWSARDRVTGQVVALKLLRDGADEPEILALVREATALSGIEGLGVPRVLHFGRLPRSDRAYMVRELVRGRSLADLLSRPSAGEPQAVRGAMSAVVQVADLLTRLHRALLLHGDIKPANIIVGEDGRATLVDLGLAAHWREGGTTPKGLTPRYAAPELFCGEPLTPRAEVFALGASLADVLKVGEKALDEAVAEAVGRVVSRATAGLPANRYPSADEFAEALRRAGRVEGDMDRRRGRVWSIVGLDGPAAALTERIRQLDRGGGLVVTGPVGSGRTTLLRRISWSLGVGGAAVAFLESPSSEAPQDPLADPPPGSGAASDAAALESEPAPSVGDLGIALEHVTMGRAPEELVLVVDDADQRTAAELDRLGELREQGATLVMVVSSTPGGARLPGRTFALYEMPPLDEPTAAALVRRMIPSLSDRLIGHIVTRTGGLPGVLRAAVTRLEGAAVVSVDDVEARLDGVSELAVPSTDPKELHRLLDRGRFEQAAQQLERSSPDGSLPIELARAKLEIGQSDPQAALQRLQQLQPRLEEQADGDLVALWHLQMARALLRVGDYDQAEVQSNLALTQVGVTLIEGLQGGDVGSGLREMTHGATVGAMVAESLAVSGLAQSFAGKHEEAIRTLRRSVEVARGCSQQGMAATALASLAVALQRGDDLDEAQQAYEEALDLAEQSSDAGMVATTRQNLAGIAKLRGDIAGALAHFEAAVDMGRRSGRKSTVQYALLNLANLDLYLGRHARARASIDALAAERDSLGQSAQAQLLALEAEQAAIEGDLTTAGDACLQCALAYEKLGRSIDAAEARLERVVWLARADAAEP